MRIDVNALPSPQSGPVHLDGPGPVRSEGNRIEVLGPVRAWRAGRELPLGPPQQRGVLALLAIAARRTLPIPEIVEALWRTQPPRTAVNVVQTYVKRLRQNLEPDRPVRHPSRVLPSTAGGYALVAYSYTVDLLQFRELAEQARAAWLAGDHALVVALLTDALALWRGAPGGDLPALASHHLVRATLEEHRAVVGLLARGSLAAGAAAQVLPTVAAAALARPLDEALQAALIRLYRAAGQRADALQVYFNARQRLRDDLGLDPGPELSAAYHELLLGP